MSKLKFLKGKLDEWHIEMFGDIRVRKNVALKEIDELDNLECARDLSLEHNQNRVDLKNSFEDLVLMGLRSRRQKMEVKWAKEGDCGSSLFLRVVNGRRRCNYIMG